MVVEKVLTIAPREVHKWLFEEMPAMLADLVISMDDRYLYFSIWLHGEVRQYDISDPFHPKLVGKVTAICPRFETRLYDHFSGTSFPH